MAPLKFGYAYRNTIDSGTLQCEAKLVLSKYFKNTYNDNPLYIRGKFVKDHYSDGLVTMPNKYSPYTVLSQYNEKDKNRVWFSNHKGGRCGW